MGKTVLFVASVVKTHIMVFHIPFLQQFKERGWTTAVAARNDYERPEECQIPFCDTYYDVPFERSPFSLKNMEALRQLSRIIDDGNFDIIHCHTPIGGVLTRLSARKVRKNGTKVIYTAHGFHFYKGAPLLNWLLYYPVERVCAQWTDALITINQEDFAFAQAHMRACAVHYVPGVGVPLAPVLRASLHGLRDAFGIPEGMLWVFTAGELIRRKNHEMLIAALATLPHVFLTIAGDGVLREKLEHLIHRLGVADRVKLIGFRDDIAELCAAADIFAFPSLQEGLPVALMEAMAAGMPCVASGIRGNVDLIDDGKGGYLVDPCAPNAWASAIMHLMRHPEECQHMSAYNREKIKQFSRARVAEQMQKIYMSE